MGITHEIECGWVVELDMDNLNEYGKTVFEGWDESLDLGYVDEPNIVKLSKKISRVEISEEYDGPKDTYLICYSNNKESDNYKDFIKTIEELGIFKDAEPWYLETVNVY